MCGWNKISFAGFFSVKRHLISPPRVQQIVGCRPLEIEADSAQDALLLACGRVEAERDEIVPKIRIVEHIVGN